MARASLLRVLCKLTLLVTILWLLLVDLLLLTLVSAQSRAETAVVDTTSLPSITVVVRLVDLGHLPTTLAAQVTETLSVVMLCDPDRLNLELLT
jgi:hypothetical protein